MKEEVHEGLDQDFSQPLNPEPDSAAKRHKTTKVGRLLRTGAALLGAYAAEGAIEPTAYAQQQGQANRAELSTPSEKPDESTLNNWLTEINEQGLSAKRIPLRNRSFGDQVQILLNGQEVAYLDSSGVITITGNRAISMERAPGTTVFDKQSFIDYVKASLKYFREAPGINHEFKLTLEVNSEARKVMEKTGVEIGSNEINLERARVERRGETSISLFRKSKQVKAVVEKLNDNDLRLSIYIEDNSRPEILIIKNGIYIK